MRIRSHVENYRQRGGHQAAEDTPAAMLLHEMLASAPMPWNWFATYLIKRISRLIAPCLEADSHPSLGLSVFFLSF